MCNTEGCNGAITTAKRPYCKPCRTNQDRLAKFGITAEEYDALLVKQEYKCAICQLSETATRRGELKQLAVDHCHDTGRIRGLLCQRCNVGLGQFQDDAELLRAAISYMEGREHGSRTR
jgi:hypothetical protein